MSDTRYIYLELFRNGVQYRRIMELRVIRDMYVPTIIAERGAEGWAGYPLIPHETMLEILVNGRKQMIVHIDGASGTVKEITEAEARTYFEGSI